MSVQLEISIVTPAYKCAGCILELYNRLKATLEGLGVDYEIIIVDDCSPMDDWMVIRSICQHDAKVHGVKLSRNYGQHFAITAGIDRARGKWVVVMDCDLQDQPEEIPKLYLKALEGWPIVFARRTNRQDSRYRRFVSKCFSLVYSWLGDIRTDNSIANFSICSENVVSAVRGFRERNRSFPMFVNEVGFPRTTVDVEHSPRYHGESAYGFNKLLDFAIQNIVSRSNKPLRLSIRFGFLLSFVSVLYAIVIVIQYFYFSVSVQGWTSLAVLVSFLGGLGFANLGIIGLYLGKVFDEVKGRPLYTVEYELNKND